MCKFKDVPGRTWGFRFLFTFVLLMITFLMLVSLSMGEVLGFAASFLLLIPILNLYPEIDC